MKKPRSKSRNCDARDPTAKNPLFHYNVLDCIESIKIQESDEEESSSEDEYMSSEELGQQHQESSSDDKEAGSERVSIPDVKEKPAEKPRKWSESDSDTLDDVKSEAIKKEQVVEDSDDSE